VIAGELAQHTIENCCVNIVSAGVHYALIFGTPLHAGSLVNGQRIYIGAQNNRFSQITSTLDAGEYACAGYGAKFDTRLG
jgi:hypothetical protein